MDYAWEDPNVEDVHFAGVGAFGVDPTDPDPEYSNAIYGPEVDAELNAITADAATLGTLTVSGTTTLSGLLSASAGIEITSGNLDLTGAGQHIYIENNANQKSVDLYTTGAYGEFVLKNGVTSRFIASGGAYASILASGGVNTAARMRDDGTDCGELIVCDNGNIRGELTAVSGGGGQLILDNSAGAAQVTLDGDGACTIDNALSLGSTLAVTGNADFSAGVALTGAGLTIAGSGLGITIDGSANEVFTVFDLANAGILALKSGGVAKVSLVAGTSATFADPVTCQNALTVNGAVDFDSTLNVDGNVTVASANVVVTGGNQSITVNDSDGDPAAVLADTSKEGYLSLFYDGAERTRIRSLGTSFINTGNGLVVGGTTTSAAFEVIGNTVLDAVDASGTLNVDGDVTFGDKLEIGDNATDDGFIGIGITPSYPLHAYRNVDTIALLKRSTANDTFLSVANTANGDSRVGVKSDGTAYLGSYSAENLELRTNNTERVRIESGGMVQILNDLTMGGVLYGSGGSNVVPCYSFDGDPNTGIYSNSPDAVGFTCGGITKSGVTSSFGLQAFDVISRHSGVFDLVTLDVGDNANFHDDSGFLEISTNGGNARVKAGVYSVGGAGGTAGQGLIEVHDASGNVALNLAGTPSFAVKSGSNNAVDLRLVNTDAGIITLRDGGNSTVVLSADGDSYFNGGNVGIGTSSPASLFHVKQSAGSATVRIEGDGANNDAILSLATDTDLWSIFLDESDSQRLKFWNGATALTLDPSGYIGTGGISPIHNLHVYENAATVSIRIQGAGGSCYVQNASGDLRLTPDTGNAIDLNGNTELDGTLDVTDDVTAGGDIVAANSGNPVIKADASSGSGYGILGLVANPTVSDNVGQIQFLSSSTIVGAIQVKTTSAAASGEMKFYTFNAGGSLSENMVLDEDGDVGIAGRLTISSGGSKTLTRNVGCADCALDSGGGNVTYNVTTGYYTFLNGALGIFAIPIQHMTPNTVVTKIEFFLYDDDTAYGTTWRFNLYKQTCTTGAPTSHQDSGNFTRSSTTGTGHYRLYTMTLTTPLTFTANMTAWVYGACTEASLKTAHFYGARITYSTTAC